MSPSTSAPSSSNRPLSSLERTLHSRLIVDVGEFCRRLELPESFARSAEAAARDFPFRFPESALDRIEKGNPNDPMLRQFLPRPSELDVVPGFSLDPLYEWSDGGNSAGDNENSAGESSASNGVETVGAEASCLLTKYRGRTLAMTTNACAARCRFCFRRHYPKNRTLFPIPFDASQGESARSAATGETVSDSEKRRSETAYFDRVFAEVRADSSISELIFSGGDPLTLSNAELESLLHYIKSLGTVKRGRFHSRVPILCPGRIDDGFPRADFEPNADGSAPLVLHMTLHANAPNEIDASVVRALLELRRRGYVLTSQTALLAGVNDSVETLTALFEKLIDAGVVPYYLHQLDRTQGAAAFEVPVERGLEIVRRLGDRLPGYAVPRYVRERPGQPKKLDLLDEKSRELERADA